MHRNAHSPHHGWQPDTPPPPVREHEPAEKGADHRGTVCDCGGLPGPGAGLRTRTCRLQPRPLPLNTVRSEGARTQGHGAGAHPRAPRALAWAHVPAEGRRTRSGARGLRRLHRRPRGPVPLSLCRVPPQGCGHYCGLAACPANRQRSFLRRPQRAVLPFGVTVFATHNTPPCILCTHALAQAFRKQSLLF